MPWFTLDSNLAKRLECNSWFTFEMGDLNRGKVSNTISPGNAPTAPVILGVYKEGGRFFIDTMFSNS